jgi:predicted O-methyltransferase YrrM
LIRRQEVIESSGSRVIQCDAKLRYLGAHLRRYVRDFGLRHFVETGTGIGESAAYVQGIEPPFATIWSCDVEQLQIERALGVYPQLGSDPRVHLSCSTSANFLSTLLPLIPADEPIPVNPC